MSLLRGPLLWASNSRWLRERCSRSRLVRRAVSRFMPGEDLESAAAAAASFQGRGIGSILTLLGENVKDAAEARAVAASYHEIQEAITRRGLDAEVSVKLTHFGLDLDPALALENLSGLAATIPPGRTLWVDMEGSAYTAVTVDLFRRISAERSNLGLCLQAYLHRTPDDLAALLAVAPRIRLVKGAYAEPASVAMPRKADVDETYSRLAEQMLDRARPGNGTGAGGGARLVFGTHDLGLIRRIQQVVLFRGLPRTCCEFHMLYGIQRREQERLAGEGWRVMALISYGSAWFPWYMRRLAERPANLWFVVSRAFTR